MRGKHNAYVKGRKRDVKMKIEMDMEMDMEMERLRTK